MDLDQEDNVKNSKSLYFVVGVFAIAVLGSVLGLNMIFKKILYLVSQILDHKMFSPDEMINILFQPLVILLPSLALLYCATFDHLANHFRKSKIVFLQRWFKKSLSQSPIRYMYKVTIVFMALGLVVGLLRRTLWPFGKTLMMASVLGFVVIYGYNYLKNKMSN